MTPAIKEIVDEICTANNDIHHVQSHDEFLTWLELLGDEIRHNGLRFEYPNFKLYSSNSAFYWPLVQKRLEEL